MSSAVVHYLSMRVCQILFIGHVWCLGVWMSQDVRVLRVCSELSWFVSAGDVWMLSCLAIPGLSSG